MAYFGSSIRTELLLGGIALGCVLLTGCGSDAQQSMVAGITEVRSDQAKLKGQVDGDKARIEALTAELRNTRARADQASQAELKRIEQLQETVKLALEKQAAVLNQAASAMIPLAPPPDLEARLKGLEAACTDETCWPRNEAMARDLLQRVTRLVEALPVWTQAQYASRLALIQWSARAHVALNRSGTSDPDVADTIVEECKETLAAAPTGALDELRDRLATRAWEMGIEADTARLALIKARQKLAIDEAERIIKRADDDHALQIADALDAELQQIGEVGAAEVRARLRLAVIAIRAERDAETFRTHWQRIKNREATDITLFELGLQGLLEEIGAARVTLAIEGLTQDPFVQLENEIKGAALTRESAREQQVVKARQAYQKWALDQIHAVQSAIADATLEAESNPDKGWTPELRGRVKDAILKHLLPIDTLLLEPRILRRYQEIDQEGWLTLERSERIELAKAAASTPKKELRAFL